VAGNLISTKRASLTDIVFAQVDALELPNHWMSDIFRAHAYADVQANNAALQVYTSVSEVFPSCSYVRAQVAKCLYNLRQFQQAQDLLEETAAGDPHRVDDVDILSNIYYVSNARAALAVLAHRVLKLDKFRPEVCCVIGNYYSLRGEHEKAVCYFRRALRLNRSYLAAWTLMGHEYMELKNKPAAIECYRRAVDINPKDYRAWYGLGQTYELMLLPVYAAYYYKRSALLRPYDPRMWCALGAVYEQTSKPDEAIACYQRAAQYQDAEGIALLKLGKLYRASGDTNTAAAYYDKFVASSAANNQAEVAQALIYLSRHAQSKGNFEYAEECATRALHLPYRNEVIEAKQIIAEIRSKASEPGHRGGAASRFAIPSYDSSASKDTNLTGPHLLANARLTPIVTSTPVLYTRRGMVDLDDAEYVELFRTQLFRPLQRLAPLYASAT
jgi:anaphase-promoting complex subunit 8